VRAALSEQNAKARVDGTPEVPEDTVMKIAEELVAQVRVADWLDRADAAAADADEIALRDLRAVVSSADDVARDESTRDLAANLRATLERRTSAEQESWLDEVRSSLAAGRVVRAPRLLVWPPQPTESLPDELSGALTEAAGSALASDAPADRWATVLDAVAYSPVRRNVAPAGAPAEPGEELLALVNKHVGRVPAIGPLFGVAPPVSKPRARPPRAAPRPAREVQAEAGLLPPPPGLRRIPPPPPPTAPPVAPTTAPPPQPTTISTEPTATTPEPTAAAEPTTISTEPTATTSEPTAVTEPAATTELTTTSTEPTATTTEPTITTPEPTPEPTAVTEPSAATEPAATTTTDQAMTSDDRVEHAVVVEELGQTVDEA
jgi:hypothetical protein